jgi:hypothetical protein
MADGQDDNHEEKTVKDQNQDNFLFFPQTASNAN